MKKKKKAFYGRSILEILKIPEKQKIVNREVRSILEALPTDLKLCSQHSRGKVATDKFTLKDSGQREKFDSGMVRDTRGGKGRFDLISPIALRRLAIIYEKGAIK